MKVDKIWKLTNVVRIRVTDSDSSIDMFSDSDKRFTNDLSIRLFVVLIADVRQLSLEEEDDRSLGVVEEGGRVLLFLLLMETKTDSLLNRHVFRFFDLPEDLGHDGLHLPLTCPLGSSSEDHFLVFFVLASPPSFSPLPSSFPLRVLTT